MTNTILSLIYSVFLAAAAVIGIVCALAILGVALIYMGGIIAAVAFVIAVVKGMTP